LYSLQQLEKRLDNLERLVSMQHQAYDMLWANARTGHTAEAEQSRPNKVGPDDAPVVPTPAPSPDPRQDGVADRLRSRILPSRLAAT
jgi:hypothetical protein